MLWLFFALSAPFVWSITNFADKFLVDKKIRDAFTITILVGLLYFCIGILIFLFSGLKILPVKETVFAFLSGAAVVFYLLPYFKALMMEETSRIAPLFEFTSIFALIFSLLFLREAINGRQLLAFPLIIAGAFILGTKKLDRGIFKLRYALWLMLISDFLFAWMNIFFRYVMYTTDFWTASAYQGIGAGIISLLLLIYGPWRQRFTQETKKLSSGTFLLLTFTNFLTILGYILLNVAISLTPVALVMVVIGVQSFMVLIEGIFLSIWFPNIIKEDIQKSTIGIKIFSIALIFIGIYLINTSTLF